ncbi:hypothetical protein JCM19240_5759 [Vibrio maritimus]|uniref:Uncharacterized protein n=1 Tax=Vibrio maritimus TaxID=990268 RepID=A0A090SZF8_9VIBR|nr:hypothetical protein JCM19240_5759 [Vibrio maritimus]
MFSIKDRLKHTFQRQVFVLSDATAGIIGTDTLVELVFFG